MTGFDSKRQAAQNKVAEMLELCDYLEGNDASLEAQCKAAAFIREVLAQPEQEPVGFIEAKADNECADAYADGWNACVRAHKDTTPPKRPWVGLTDEEVLGCLGPEAVRIPPGWSKLTRAVEAKLKEKNFD